MKQNLGAKLLIIAEKNVSLRQNMRIMKFFLISISLLLVLTACEKEHSNTPPQPSQRTVMVYMAADNNLSSLSVDDIWEMEDGAKNIPTGNTMVLFVDKRYNSEYPFIAKLTGDPNAPLDTLYKYDSERYDSDPTVFKEALQKMMEFCPAKEYGLVLWGHGTGWAVDPDTISSQSTRRAYGYDDGNQTWMNITQMASALNGLPKMKFIFADCCHMACIEVAYELRNYTEYFIGSPAEIPGRGAPYATLLKELFNTTPTFYQNIVDAYYNYYANSSNLSSTERYSWSYMEDGYSVPLSVINTTYLPQLATATRELIDNIPNGYPEYPNSPDFNGIAYYFGLDVPMMYDMRAVMSRINPDRFAEWDAVYSQAVPYSRMSMKWMTVFDGRYVGSQYYYPYFYDLRTDMVSERFDATLPYGCVSMYFPVVGKGYDEGDFCYNLRANNFEWNRLMQWNRFGWTQIQP